MRATDWDAGPVSVVPGRRPGARRPDSGNRPFSLKRHPIAPSLDESAAASTRSPVLEQPLFEPVGPAPDDGDPVFREDWHLASTLELESSARPSTLAGGLPLSNWGWAAGIVGLVLVMILQVAYFQRNDFAGYPQLRPWMERLCALTDCELPLQRELARIQLARGQVSDHPRQPGALVATAVLMNEAPFRQPYPLLKLSLLDENQNVTGERWFHPSDYLEDAGLRARWASGMPSGLPVAVRLDLVDPGSGSAQYVFDYR
ncbi:MAG: DUF3426 domain-containing protein [Ectothiorhodospiraceae bacterium]|nr:DUF3426 domain-containing protein [Ectothiorhodospiraceae bacterium]